MNSVHVRLFTTLRTAHLERARQLPPAAIVHTERRYDFDEKLAAGLEIIQVPPGRAALLLARSRVQVLEVNEPLMRSSLRMTAAAIAGVRLRARLTRQDVAIVTYAIENRDPWSSPPGGPRARLRRPLDRALARFVWRRIDRVCFGTPAARELYGRILPATRAESTLIPALPVALDRDLSKDPYLVTFLGAFLPRKGIDRVLAAWPGVREVRPGARLRVLGKGPWTEAVLAAAAADASIEVTLDPPRDVITDVLARTQVLVLPSQPTPTWREQVGLPLVEALAAGCSVVTTSETGLADWLRDHGHAVIEPGGGSQPLVAAVAGALAAARPAADVVADLPAADGRLAADAWMFDRPAGPVGPVGSTDPPDPRDSKTGRSDQNRVDKDA